MTTSPVDLNHGPTHEADRGPAMPALDYNAIRPASRTLWIGMLAVAAALTSAGCGRSTSPEAGGVP